MVQLLVALPGTVHRRDGFRPSALQFSIVADAHRRPPGPRVRSRRRRLAELRPDSARRPAGAGAPAPDRSARGGSGIGRHIRGRSLPGRDPAFAARRGRPRIGARRAGDGRPGTRTDWSQDARGVPRLDRGGRGCHPAVAERRGSGAPPDRRSHLQLRRREPRGGPGDRRQRRRHGRRQPCPARDPRATADAAGPATRHARIVLPGQGDVALPAGSRRHRPQRAVRAGRAVGASHGDSWPRPRPVGQRGQSLRRTFEHGRAEQRRHRPHRRRTNRDSPDSPGPDRRLPRAGRRTAADVGCGG